MKTLYCAAIGCMAAACIGVSGSANATDMNYEQAMELAVSGVVESWNGYSFVSDYTPANANPANVLSHDDYFVSGTSGRLSLPLGDSLSIQQDVEIEVTGNAYEDETGNNYIYSYQMGTHLSFLDPGMGLIGAFGGWGAGTADGNRAANDRPDSLQFRYVGGEAQMYVDDFTFYVQAGYLDAERTNTQNRDDTFRDAVFVRGVGRWFMSETSRLELEFSYADGDADTEPDDHTVLEWGVRYDTVLAGLPIIGDTPVFVGYRGARFENDDAPGNPNGGGGGEGGLDSEDYLDHTIMVGTSWSFGGGNMKQFDRVGATLDLPNFGRWVASGENLD
ncbi:MAG: hypothetical protein AAGA00_00010 [Pseudomonadota bacterium]